MSQSESATVADASAAVEDVADAPSSGCGSCACGAGGCGGGTARVPALDARPIDPAIRQSAVFGVLIGLPPGAAAEIVTDSSPDLVLTLIEGQFSGQYSVTGGQVGDEEWRTTFTRVA